MKNTLNSVVYYPMQEKVSFTQDIKEELSMNSYSAIESKSLLAAFIKLSGSLRFTNHGEILTLKTENATIAKFIYRLVKEQFPNVIISFSFVKVMKLYKATTYLINISQGLDELIKDINLDFLNSKIPYELHNKEDKVRAYLIGTFLASGSCNNPATSNYHFEFACNDEEYAHSILKLINKIKTATLNFKIIKRRNKYIVYLKRSDQISDFLAYLNANHSCIEFENIRMDRDFSNTTNRLMNCDSYNFKKTIEIANKQIELLKTIDNKLGINNIQNVKVRTFCQVRMANPEATYQEIAELMSEKLEETVTKSNVNHIVIKIKKMVEDFKNNEN